MIQLDLNLDKEKNQRMLENVIPQECDIFTNYFELFLFLFFSFLAVKMLSQINKIPSPCSFALIKRTCFTSWSPVFAKYNPLKCLIFFFTSQQYFFYSCSRNRKQFLNCSLGFFLDLFLQSDSSTSSCMISIS
jgi:hypothetical protein